MASGFNRDSVDEVKAADSVSSHVAVLEHPSVQVVNAKKYGAVGDGRLTITGCLLRGKDAVADESGVVVQVGLNTMH